MEKIGLTGGICTGKTFVLNIFKEFKTYTVMADEIAKNFIFSKDSPILGKLEEIFGEEVVDKNKGVNKPMLSKILFQDGSKRELLNHTILPYLIEERESTYIDLKKNSNYDFFIYESALLVESGTYKDFDKIVVVYTTPEEQFKRLQQRDQLSAEETENRIKSQYPLSEKLKVANYIIDTTGSFELSRTKALETYYLMKKDSKID